MKKIIWILLLPVFMAACNLDSFPSDAMTSGQLAGNPASAVYTTDGTYSMFKDALSYKGTSSDGSTYVRHYFQMSEFRGDNVALSQKTEDPLFGQMCYNDLVTDDPNSYLWWCAYHVIYSANSVIESLPEGTSGFYDHILGENYCMRALCHLHLVTLFSKPYSHGRENKGVILRTETESNATVRASVGEVYDQIRDDLIKAAALMAADESRVTNAGYISRDAALGLLSRVYLYRGEDDKVIETVNGMLGGDGADPTSKLDPDCEGYFANALKSKETLWAVAHMSGADGENRKKSSIGSMYFTVTARGTEGWAEMPYSDPLLKLFQHNPTDRRYTGYMVPLLPVEGALQARWGVDDGSNVFRLNELRDVIVKNDNYFVADDNGNEIALTEEVKFGFTHYYIQWKGEKHEVFVDQKMDQYNRCPLFMNRKFTGQDGEVLLSSPVMIRWGEVVLNRAEAYAKSGQAGKALADVNVIRSRAGLSGAALYTEGTIAAAGYANALEVVLDERRLELCFEGHRAFDIYRNKLKMDRRFVGAQPWEEVEHTDNRIQYRIPYDEISVSGIPQND